MQKQIAVKGLNVISSRMFLADEFMIRNLTSFYVSQI